MPNHSRDIEEDDNPISQIQLPGMSPVYTGQRGERELVGYKYDVNSTPVVVPKPASVLAEEKKLGIEMKPVYKTMSFGQGNTIEYGPPTEYGYVNDKNQYVSYDSRGNYLNTVQKSKSNGLEDLLKFAATAAGAYFLGPIIGNALGIGGAGAAVGAGEGVAGIGAASHLTPAALEALAGTAGYGTSAAAEAALAAGAGGAGITSLAAPITETTGEIAAGTNAAGAGGYGSSAANPSLLSSTGAAGAAPSVNEMIASGMSPGSLGALNAEALTPEALAAAEIANLPSAASGIGSLGASEGALTASEIANLPQLTSINEMVASGMAPGAAGASGAASGLLTPAELAAASGVVTEGATPALFEMARAGKGLPSANEAVASGLSPGSAGAKAAAEGTLTGQELAAAAGTAGALNKDGIGDLLTKAKDAITGKAKDVLSGSGSGSGMGVLGLMALMAMMNKGNNTPQASTVTIPELTATRSQLPYDVDKKGVNPNTPYRPGQGGVNYFSPTTYTPKAAGGGLMSLERPNLGGYSDGGRLLQGPGDGVSDSIPAIIGKKQPARLANGEFVIPARIVSELGNGSTDAGAKRLYEMMDRVQRVRRNTKNVAANTKASKYLPA